MFGVQINNCATRLLIALVGAPLSACMLGDASGEPERTGVPIARQGVETAAVLPGEWPCDLDLYRWKVRDSRCTAEWTFTPTNDGFLAAQEGGCDRIHGLAGELDNGDVYVELTGSGWDIATTYFTSTGDCEAIPMFVEAFPGSRNAPFSGPNELVRVGAR